MLQFVWFSSLKVSDPTVGVDFVSYDDDITHYLSNDSCNSNQIIFQLVCQTRTATRRDKDQIAGLDN